MGAVITFLAGIYRFCKKINDKVVAKAQQLAERLGERKLKIVVLVLLLADIGTIVVFGIFNGLAEVFHNVFPVLPPVPYMVWPYGFWMPAKERSASILLGAMP